MTRNNRLLLIPLLLVCGSLSAGEPQHAPRIVCDEPVYDFGERDNRGVVEHTFTIRNEGDLTLEISRVRSSCGCTVVQTSSRSVPPGGSAQITARFNLRGRRGPQHKTITVESNDPRQPRLLLHLQGTAVQEMNLSPDRFFFGQTSAAEPVSRTVTISSATVTFHITNITCNSALVNVDSEVVEEGHTYRLTARLKNAVPEGSFHANVRVYTDSAKYPTIDLPVWAKVTSAITTAPRELVVPSQGPVLTRYIVLRETGGHAFHITNVSVPQPGITVTTNNFPGGGYRVTLSNIQPSPELRDTEVIIETDHPQMPRVTIPFRVLSM